MSNILLKRYQYPPFDLIKTEDIESAIDYILATNRKKIEHLLSHKKYTWDNLIAPLEELEEKLNEVWSLISHLHAVKDTVKLRKAYNQCLPKITAYSIEMSHNKKLYQAIKDIAHQKSFHSLNHEQQRIIKNRLKDFKLAGVALKKKEKERFAVLENTLSQLSSKFDENLMDSTQSWALHLTSEKQLSGLPKHIIISAKQSAQRKKLKGWDLTLDFPTYYAVMAYADQRKIREKMYKAYTTRASDRGSHNKKFDNTKIMDEILAIRDEMAALIGFHNYVDYSITTKMAKKACEVINFLETILKKSKSTAKCELRKLKRFAKKQLDIEDLQPWDLSYVSEKLRKAQFDFSEEELRLYFPEEKVLTGLFDLVRQLYGIVVTEKFDKKTWHSDVRYFEIRDANKALLGSFYMDLYARKNKRDGAWLGGCRSRRRLPNKEIQRPIAFLVCNFSKPSKSKPSLFTHDEVITLFHEFGHCLHHLLSKVNYADISGTNGVEWDAIELPSQFMENFCWEKSVMDSIALHYKTHKPLPNDLFEKLLASKNFNAGLFLLRQIEFGLFDFKIHQAFDKNKGAQIQKILNQVRKQTSLLKLPDYNRFQHSFSHIFNGAYAAGYYSYLWAEVLSSDAFSTFKSHGIFNKKIAQSFLHNILEKGGSEDAMILYKKFRGRKPKIDALLKSYGL